MSGGFKLASYPGHPPPPREWPGIHCLRMRLIFQNSENLGYCRIVSAYDYVTFAYESANVSVSRSYE